MTDKCEIDLILETISPEERREIYNEIDMIEILNSMPDAQRQSIYSTALDLTEKLKGRGFGVTSALELIFKLALYQAKYPEMRVI